MVQEVRRLDACFACFLGPEKCFMGRAGIDD